jgi:uncharacterized membrane protein YoaK (UPF0700 family)
MIALDRSDKALAAALAALAGFVDAIGFMGMGGFFVSFMSGNSTRLGVGVASEAAAAAVAGSLVAAFVVGVSVGAFASRLGGRRSRTAVLSTVAMALALAALLHQPGAVPGAFLLVAFAMGAENMVFQRNGDVAFGLTYMTGTLVRIGQRLADALSGGPRWDWLPWMLLWAGLVSGGVLGALAWIRFGADSLWVAAGLAAALAAATFKRPASLTS